MRIDDAHLILDTDGAIIAASATASELLGYSPAELLSMKAVDLLACNGVQAYTAAVLGHDFRALASGDMTAAEGDVQVRCKSGESIPLRWKISSLENASSERTLLIDLWRVEAGVPVSPVAGGYRDIFEHAVEGLYRSSIEGHYLEVNPALARIYGYASPSHLIAGLQDINTQLYVQPTRRAEFMQCMKRDNTVSDFESEVLRADGSSIWIAEFGRVVKSAMGRPIYFEGSVIDITARKHAETAVRASEEKFRHLVEMTNVIPWEADIETSAFTYVGPQAFDFLGYEIKNWLEPGFWDRIVHADDRAWVSVARGEAIEKRQRFECEYRLFDRDGNIVWIREIVSVLPSPDGRPALGGFMLDVTYRRESEALLRESQDFIEQIAEASPTISYLYDPARPQSLYINGRVPTILGYTKETLAEMRPFFMIALGHPDEIDGHFEYFDAWKRASLQDVFEREFRLRNSQGGWVWLRSRECIFRRDWEGETMRILGTVEDITIRRNAMEELQNNERIFRRLVETTGAVPFEFDTNAQRFAYVGPQAESVFGHPLRRWYGAEFWSAFIVPEDAVEAMRFTREPSTSAQGDFQTEFRVLSADVRRIWVRQIVHYAPEENEGKRVRGFFFDVTEAREAELEREKSRHQLRELAARGQQMREEERLSIAREIHDELGQSLTFLRIELAWLSQRIAKAIPDDVRIPLEEKLQSMEGGVQTTLATVRRILSALRPPLLDELGLVEAVEWQMQDFSKRIGIRHEINAAPVKSLSRECSMVVFRIFQEILTNAARHAKASRIKVYLHETEDQCVLRVEDNGVGISPLKLQQSKNFGLLGMRERAWSVGGEVDITTTPGHGTIITLRIPIVRSSAAPAL